MGGNESKAVVTNLVDNHVINKSTVDSFNKSVSKYMAESLINITQSCSNSTITMQEIKLNFGNIVGDLNISGLSQDTRAIINLQCINKIVAQNKMANDIVNKILDSVKSSNDAMLLAKLEAIAKQSQTTSGSGGIANVAKSETNNITYNEVQNINETYLQNVVENNVSMKMSTDVVQNIINKSVSNQVVNVATGDIGKSVNISNISQQLTIDSIVKAIQDSNIIGDIVNSIVHDLGGNIDNTNKASSDITEKGKSDSTQVTHGIIEAIGNTLSKIISTFTGPFLWIAIAIGVFIFIIIVLIIVKLFSSGGSTSENVMQPDYGNMVEQPYQFSDMSALQSSDFNVATASMVSDLGLPSMTTTS